MRRWLLAMLGGLAVVACVGALLLRFTPLLDDAVEQFRSEPGEAELAKRFHRGGRSCLRYTTTTADTKDVDDLAQALVDAGVPPERLSELVFQYRDLMERDEAVAHERSEAEELVGVNVEAATPMQRPLVLLKRERMRKWYESRLTSVVAGRSRGAPLSAAEHAVLDPVWRDHPEVLMVGGMVKVLRQLRARLTAKRLDALAAFVRGGAAADVFDASKLPAALATDGYAHPIHTDVSGNRVVLTSYGADGREGGTGDDADQTRVVALGSGAAAAAVGDELAVARGEAPAAKVSLARAEIDAAFEHTEQLAAQARLVPAFVSGKPVGFKIFAIRKGSLYEHIGLENGDVVTAIDGFDLSSPEKALEVYSHLRDATAATLSLTRAAKPYSIRIEVTP